jgi:curved DNA-binding protein CbpA
MARRRDLYEVLGVARGADAEAIRKSYRQLARKFHPDLNQGRRESEDRFKEVSEAYAVLSDAEKRALYDDFGAVSLEAGFDANAARASRRFGGGRGYAATPWLQHRGRVRRRVRAADAAATAPAFRGEDVEVTLELSSSKPHARHPADQRDATRSRRTATDRARHAHASRPASTRRPHRVRARAPSRSGRPPDLFARIRIRPERGLRRDGRDVLSIFRDGGRSDARCAHRDPDARRHGDRDGAARQRFRRRLRLREGHVTPTRRRARGDLTSPCRSACRSASTPKRPRSCAGSPLTIRPASAKE